MEGSETTRGKDEHEAARLAAIDHLGAVRAEVDLVLQELVDDVHEAFGTDLCMVNLVLSDVQYFRAWSGELYPGNSQKPGKTSASAACASTWSEPKRPSS
jgi:hypothetical protein